MSQQKSYQTHTETESETDLDVLRAIVRQKEQLDSHKAKGFDAGKKGNTKKRSCTLFFILSWYILPLHFNALAWIFNLNVYGLFLVSELSNVWRDKQKDRISHSAGVM